jgi:dienelactone hydrolase
MLLLLLLLLQAVVKKDVYAIVEALRSRGVTKFASLGFCWGASMAIQALHDGETFSAAGMLHPSLFGQVCSWQLLIIHKRRQTEHTGADSLVHAALLLSCRVDQLIT